MYQNLVIRLVCLLGLAIGTYPNAWSQTTQPSASRWQRGNMRQTPPTPAMRYFGNVAADPVVGQRRPQLLAMSHPVPLTSSKPFENAVRQPTLSPYLSLNLIENETGLPNYHAWVRPQVRQRETDRERSFQTRRQQRKLQAVDASSQVSPNRGGQVPTTDGTSRFLNLGSYFPGLRK